MAYHRQQGVDTAIVRIFNTYGPRMRPNDGRAIPTFIRQALEEKPLTVFGDGSQTRSFCYVDDLIRGLILLAESGEHLPVNIGNPAEMTLSSSPRRSSRAPARRARSSSRRCRSTTRRCGSRTSRARASYSAGSPRSRSRTGCAARSSRSAGTRRVPRVARGSSRPPLSSSSPRASPPGSAALLQLGIFDDTLVLYGEPDRVFRSSEHRRPARPGQPLVGRAPGSASRPASRATRRPDRPRVRLGTYDRTVRFAVATAWSSSSRSSARRRGRTRQGLERRADERARPPAVRDRGASRYSGTSSTPTASAAARQDLDRLERAEQPRLPEAAVPADRGKWAIQTGRTTRRSATRSSRGSSRSSGRSKVACGVTGAARQQQPELEPRLGLAAPVPAGDEGGRRQGVRRLRAPSVLRLAGRDAFDHAAARASRPARRRRSRSATSHARAELNRLYGKRNGSGSPSTATRRTRPTGSRRPVHEAGALPDAGERVRAPASADRHVPLVPAPRRGPARRLAVRADDVRRQAQAELQRVSPRRARSDGLDWAMAKGYAEGPAAEEAERRREELAEGLGRPARSGSRSRAARPTTPSGTSSAGPTTSTRTSCSRRARRGASASCGFPSEAGAAPPGRARAVR